MNRLKAVSEFLLVAGVVLAIGTARAEGEGAIFPSASGDVADPIAWGGTYAETMTLPEDFTLPSGTFYFSSNVTFASGYKARGTDLKTIDQGEHSSVVVKLGGVEATRYQGASTVFKGGTYDIMGKSFNMYRGGHEEGVRGGTFTLQDGVVITNASSVGMTATHNWAIHQGVDKATTLNVTGDSRLYTGDFTMGVGEGHYCVLNIEDGGEVHASGVFKTSSRTEATCCEQIGWPTATAARSGRHYATVSGVGSLLDVGGDFWCGTRFFDTTLTVTNGGNVVVGGTFYTGYSGASNVLVKVTDASSLVATTKPGNYVGNVTIGYDAAAQDNRLVIEGEGSVVTGIVMVGRNGRNNALVLRDGAKLVLPEDLFPQYYSMVGMWSKDGINAMSNALVVAGDKTSIEWPSTKRFSLFGNGSEGRAVFTDGFQWTTGAPNTISVNADTDEQGTGCRIEITDNAIVGNPGTTAWEVAAGSSASHKDNVIYVARGGELKGKWIYMNGVNNRVVVSNGTVSCSGGWTEVGYRDNTAVGFVLQGTTPKITTNLKVGSGQAGVTNDFIRFEVPAEGYQPSALPLLSGTIHFNGTAKPEADVSAWLANKENDKAEYLLASNVSTLADEKIESANANMPRGCRFRKDGTKLYLRCSRPQGLVLIVR